MVKFILLLDPAQDRDCIFHPGFFDHQRLEPPRKSGIFLNIFAIFIERGCTHAMKLATGKRRLDQIGRIHGTIRFARPHQNVHLVNKEDDFTRCSLDFFQNRFQPFLEFTAIFRTCNQRAHIQSHQTLFAQAFGNVTIDDAQGKAFGNRGFPDTRLPNQDGVILGAAAENLHRAADFLIAPDDRVNLPVPRGLRQIPRIFLESLIAIFSRGGISRATLTDVIDRSVQGLSIDPARLKRRFRWRFHKGQRGQNPLNRHETIARFGGKLFGFVQNLYGLAVYIDLPRIPCDFG